MNCPYCKILLMNGMTTCPKCKWDLNTTDGGPKHQIWLDDHNPEIIAEREKARLEAEAIENAEMQAACAKMLISSGFNFEGYRIVKYSGYISGDDACQIPRSGFFSNGNNGQNLTNALVKIRRQALKELKAAAYDLGCNAVIGVDFDYITLEPETVSLGSHILEPYVICVTANGNAVVIEKDE